LFVNWYCKCTCNCCVFWCSELDCHRTGRISNDDDNDDNAIVIYTSYVIYSMLCSIRRRETNRNSHSSPCHCMALPFDTTGNFVPTSL